MNQKKQLVLLVLFISSGLLNAQTDFRSGYIIRALGDTAYGEIDYRGDLRMSTICKFKSSDKEIKEYTPNDILAYRFTDSKYFVSREINGGKVFLEYLIKGELNIYYLRDDEGDHYYLDKEGEKLMEIPYEKKIKDIDDKLVFYESKNHIGLLKYYMQDAPGLQSSINNMSKPEHQSLIKLAEKYHNVVCDGEKCIIYEKKQPFITVNLEVLGGVTYFRPYIYTLDPSLYLNHKLYFQGGVIGHLWMPRTNENLYLRTGILFSRLGLLYYHSSERIIDIGFGNIYKIPIHIEYVYPKGIIKPKLSYGLNFYFPKYPLYSTVSLNLGANIKLLNSLYLSLTSDIELDAAMMVMPIHLKAYSFNIGLDATLFQDLRFSFDWYNKKTSGILQSVV